MRDPDFRQETLEGTEELKWPRGDPEGRDRTQVATEGLEASKRTQTPGEGTQ